ncbi:glycosyltransferase family 4 protein [Kordiimonas sp.]|uniref:glycosyltransferase family 4 protein n=1 Tax=Kordiimonas sp. TaxID=1970157 RepID=UPI003A8E85CF
MNDETMNFDGKIEKLPAIAPSRAALPSASKLRVALFSGNYNYVKDGANQALNKLVAFLETQGAQVRVYSPTVAEPAFPPAGTLISAPSIPVPFRTEYRIALGLPRYIKRDLDAFKPNIIHISAPDPLCRGAVKYGRKRGLVTVASVHTRFDTYLRYYRLGALERYLSTKINKVYNQCNEIFVPTPCMETTMRETGVTVPIKKWSRGVDDKLFNPAQRDLTWRKTLGFEKQDVVISFVGRLVLEKGLEQFVAAINFLRRKGLTPHVMVVGDGPARKWFQQRLPDAKFLGFLTGKELARAYASSDIFFNPSRTEAFGNVTLEAMASGVPQVCVDATGSRFLVRHAETGFLAPPDDATAMAQHLEELITNPCLRRAFSAASTARSRHFHWDNILLEVLSHYQRSLVGKAEQTNIL